MDRLQSLQSDSDLDDLMDRLPNQADSDAPSLSSLFESVRRPVAQAIARSRPCRVALPCATLVLHGSREVVSESPCDATRPRSRSLALSCRVDASCSAVLHGARGGLPCLRKPSHAKSRALQGPRYPLHQAECSLGPSNRRGGPCRRVPEQAGTTGGKAESQRDRVAGACQGLQRLRLERLCAHHRAHSQPHVKDGIQGRVQGSERSLSSSVRTPIDRRLQDGSRGGRRRGARRGAASGRGEQRGRSALAGACVLAAAAIGTVAGSTAGSACAGAHEGGGNARDRTARSTAGDAQ
eukprot:7379559-Prymnesium_polylepis.1